MVLHEVQVESQRAIHSAVWSGRIRRLEHAAALMTLDTKAA